MGPAIAVNFCLHQASSHLINFPVACNFVCWFAPIYPHPHPPIIMARTPASILLLGLALYSAAGQGSKCVPACKNGGACTAIEGLTDEFFCKCPPGFMGADCTAVYAECQKGLVCYNGGKCAAGDEPGSETCVCPADKWVGATCKVPVDTCSNKTANSLACLNGGSCVLDTGANEWYCKCPPNVRGRHCQFGVKECKDGMYCMNDGTCSADGTSCVCPPGFFGLHCQNNERDPNAGRIARGNVLPPWAIALIVIGGVVIVTAAAVIGFLVHRERKGSPYFKSWENQASGVTHI